MSNHLSQKPYIHETSVAPWLLEYPPKEFDYVDDPLAYAWWTLHVMIEAFKEQYPQASWNTVTHHIFEDLNLWDTHLDKGIQNVQAVLAGAKIVPSSKLAVEINGEENMTDDDKKALWEGTLSFLKLLRSVPKQIRTFYHDQNDRNQGYVVYDFDHPDDSDDTDSQSNE